MSNEELEKQKLQLDAYNRRDEIKVGDKFIWNRANSRKDCYRIYSGSLPHDYMAASEQHIPSGWSEVFTVCKVYEGLNGYGQFVDYWLTDAPIVLDGMDFKWDDCIIVNGPDAFKMERWDSPLALPADDYIRYISSDGKVCTQCTERQILKHCIGLDNLQSMKHKPYFRHGKQYFKPYRNYFCTYPDDKLWVLMCANGLAEHSEVSPGGLVSFWLTRRGLDWLGDRLDMKIYNEER